MWRGILPGRAQRHRQHVARFLRVHDGVDVSPGSGVPRVELVLVIGSHLLDAILQPGFEIALINPSVAARASASATPASTSRRSASAATTTGKLAANTAAA